MANISIDALTLANNPTTMTMIRADNLSAEKLTLSSVGYFNFGSTLVGKKIRLVWPFMQTSEFTSLDTKYVADNLVVFDPQDGTARAFNVRILNFDGEYFHDLTDVAGAHRRNVRMTLLIISQV